MATRYAPSTVNGMTTALPSSMTYFVERGWLAVNPCRGVRQIEDPEGSYAWIRTKAEINRLLLACSDELRDMVGLALGTGLRIDELLHLQWVDIDLDRRLITVHRGSKGTVKTGKVRSVPILDSVLQMLRRRALARAGAILVFPARAASRSGNRRCGARSSGRWPEPGSTSPPGGTISGTLSPRTG